MLRELEFSDFVIDLAGVRPMLALEEVRPEVDLARWLAIGVAGTALVRKSWVDPAEVSESLYGELRATEAPTPRFDSKARHRSLEAGSPDAKLTRCRTCASTPGRNMCAVCGGSGQQNPGTQDATRCFGCEGGYLPCPACEGSLKSYDVRIEYHEDTPVNFAHVFVPEDVAELRAPMSAFLQRQTSIPSVLAINLTDDFAARDAYRGRRGDHEHQGHRFGGTLALARRYVERFVKSPSIAASRYSALAWPFATLSHSPHTGFAIHADGTAGRL